MDRDGPWSFAVQGWLASGGLGRTLRGREEADVEDGEPLRVGDDVDGGDGVTDDGEGKRDGESALGCHDRSATRALPSELWSAPTRKSVAPPNPEWIRVPTRDALT